MKPRPIKDPELRKALRREPPGEAPPEEDPPAHGPPQKDPEGGNSPMKVEMTP